MAHNSGQLSNLGRKFMRKKGKASLNQLLIINKIIPINKQMLKGLMIHKQKMQYIITHQSMTRNKKQIFEKKRVSVLQVLYVTFAGLFFPPHRVNSSRHFEFLGFLCLKRLFNGRLGFDFLMVVNKCNFAFPAVQTNQRVHFQAKIEHMVLVQQETVTTL